MEQQLNLLIDKLNQNSNHTHNRELLLSQIEKLALKPSYPIILVGGTNGKGSTCCYLTHILLKAGYRVGTYTSPHVFKYNERIQIDGKDISTELLLDALNQVSNNGTLALSLFEAFTLAMHFIGINSNIEIAVVEVGLGGRLDPTNLFEPYISAITNVTLDHCHLLGDSVNAIGFEKAHIFRKAKSAFFGNTKMPKSVSEYANSIGTKVLQYGIDFGNTNHDYGLEIWTKKQSYPALPYPLMRSAHQVENLSLALAILEYLPTNFVITRAHIKNGILNAQLPGRFQILPGNPQTILDVAHNIDSVTQMIRSMVKLAPVSKSFAVFGISCDKDITEIIRICLGKFDKWYIAPLHSNRLTNNENLVKIMTDLGIDSLDIVVNDNIYDAYLNCKKIATDNDRICCFGSFLVVDAVLSTHK